ncbi:hypothetical protein T4A_716 [Trichinella pseudospiralis]|uniref:Uncharacterized protein n=1 Tax=Trichinella pseudospiralis TaxID=6337 RepID=A0A0V1E3L6_TRIPS|nr:hypothetical protein T4A_716 [Trichinella pseudospiralis]KRZ35423.1 hypothetical protein T4C_2658 [Trichinella pseudospiralis]
MNTLFQAVKSRVKQKTSAAENCYGVICHEADLAAVKNCYATGNISTTCQPKDGLGKAASRQIVHLICFKKDRTRNLDVT